MKSSARCVKCQQPLREGARFCPNCGTDVAEASQSAPASDDSVVECPSCHHENLQSASFCAACGTQLHTAGQSPAGYKSSTAPDADPWATGPGYAQPMRPEASCPRCGSFRNPGETACVSCGMPFEQQSTTLGIPTAVSMEGNPAGFWIRFVASFIDGIIVGIFFFLIGLVMGQSLFDSTGQSGLFLLLQYVIPTLYNAILLTVWGTTPGKKLFNIYILDARGSKKIGFPRALGRELSKYVSAFILLIGYIMAAFRADKRALHDLMAGTFPTTRNLRR